MWWLFDPVIGDALRAVGDGDRAALAESKGFERAPHWYVVLMRVTAQVIRALCRELEDRPSNTAPAHRGHAVDDAVVGIRMPRAVDLGVGLVWPGSEREYGERPSLIGHEETVSARDVFFSINATRVSVGPLSRIPVRLHERAGMLIRPLDEYEVVRGSDSNLHLTMIGGVGGAPDGWRRGVVRWRANPFDGSAGRVPRLPLKGLTYALRG